jgi:DNA gyrase subunit A
MTNKASLIERIAELARDGALEGLSDLRDESDRQGMRVVIELSSKAEADKVLEKLYKRTQMRSTFSVILLALVNGEPTMLSLKQALFYYLEHRLEIIKRRSQHDLDRAKARAHILEGLRVALANLDEVIQLIRKSQTVDSARQNLMKRFKLSEVQAQAILDMPLRRLAALERKKIEDEYKELQAAIKALEALLKSPKKMRTVIAEELGQVKEKYGDRRRTQVIEMGKGLTKADLLTTSSMIPDENVWVAVHPNGKMARILEGKSPRPSGSAAPSMMVIGNTRDTLYLVAKDGTAASIALHAVPEAESPEVGVHYTKLSPLSEKDELATMFSLPAPDQRARGWFITTASVGGLVKKSEVVELPGPSAQTFTLAKTKGDDQIAWVAISDGSRDFLMATRDGMAIRYSEDEVRPMGLAAAGVNGIKLKGDDQVIGFTAVDPEFELFLVLNAGQAKRVKIKEFPAQGRYGQGVRAWSLEKGQAVAGIAHDKPNQRLTIHVQRLTPKSYRLDEAKARKRASSGATLVDLADDEITFVAAPWQAPSGMSTAPSGAKPAQDVQDDSPKQAILFADDDESAPKKQKKADTKKKSPAKKAASKKNTAAKKKTSTRKAKE